MDDLNFRTYGSCPYSVVVVHGGPGAPGEMAPVARELSRDWGVLEPFQTATTLNGQIDELKNHVGKSCDGPVVLVGYSWGAWLSYMVAAQFPADVRKLILVGSPPFEAKYLDDLNERRRSRLTNLEREEYDSLLRSVQALDDGSLQRLASLTKTTDSYDSLEDESEVLKCNSDSFKGVWPEAAALRRSGQLLQATSRIKCPVTAIHGDFDPHPPWGVELPLKERLPNLRFIELSRCGHTPWQERWARERFFQVLRDEIGTS